MGVGSDYLWRRHRLLVSGGSALPAEAAALWTDLGRLVAKDDSIEAVTGGLRCMLGTKKLEAADWAFVKGFEQVATWAQLSERLETVVPGNDYSELERFTAGKPSRLVGLNAQARRFHMVASCDVVVTIGGGRGTASIIDLALALGKPVLPVACATGVSEETWRQSAEEIQKHFRLNEEEVRSLSSPNSKVAAQLVFECLRRGFARKCFVVMPFRPAEKYDAVYGAIQDALSRNNLLPIRTDRDLKAGNVNVALVAGIEHCWFVVADVTESKPNVLYEIGLAHGFGKTVIMVRGNCGEMMDPPFDIRNEQMLTYDDVSDLSNKLAVRIRAMTAPRGLRSHQSTESARLPTEGE